MMIILIIGLRQHTYLNQQYKPIQAPDLFGEYCAVQIDPNHLKFWNFAGKQVIYIHRSIGREREREIEVQARFTFGPGCGAAPRNT
jgi:hypothetical protein